MLTNYLRLTLRLLIRNPFFTAVNVIGLSIGFAVFFGLWDFTSAELKTDQHYPDGESIGRICVDWRWTDDGQSWGHMQIAKSPASLPSTIRPYFPELQDYTRIFHQDNFTEARIGHGFQVVFSYLKGKKPISIKETGVVYADANLFKFFGIPVAGGDPNTVLAQPGSIALSHRAAKKFFGNHDPVGELLILNNTTSLTVTGVFPDLSTNTHLGFDYVISNAAWKTSWDHDQGLLVSSYVKLAAPVFESVAKKINDRIREYWGQVFITFPQTEPSFFVQPLKDVAFGSHGFVNQSFSPKSKTLLHVFAAVAIVILVMAWVNCLNLTITRMSRRSKEIAVRRMTGARSWDFIKQFLLEALVVNTIAAAMAATILQVFRQPAYTLLNIAINDITDISTETRLIFTITVITGILITGLYPAAISWKRTPVTLFRMKFKGRTGNVIPSVLTTVQYAAGIILIFCGLLIHRQLNFILTKDLGFDKSNVLLVEMPPVKSPATLSGIHTLQEMVNKKPYVASATLTSSFFDLKLEHVAAGTNFIMTDGNVAQENFISFYKLTLLAGRNFGPGEKTQSIIVSRIATQRLGFKSVGDACGAKVMMAIGINSTPKETEIIGVTEDYRTTPFFAADNNSESQLGRGFGYLYGENVWSELPPQVLCVKLGATDAREGLADLEDTFKTVFPEIVFSASFLEDQINRTYFREKITRNQVTFFTCLAITIACLGLLAMISNKVEEKTKEIGIRKALGAGIPSIGRVLLGSTFVQLLVSMMIGIPTGWYLSIEYLRRYSERIAITWWHFLIPALLLCVMLFVTIATQLWRASRTNPADTLRYE
jgi:putative ABC transport system permease protein